MKKKKEIQFNVSIEQIKEAAFNLTIDNTQSYLIAYQAFIDYFFDKKQLNRHDIIIGSHFVYGWMPTILELKNIDKLDNAVILLNTAKNGKLLNVEELELLRKCFNNSLVGSSKLLHFINPEQYAIWDSLVFKYLTGDEAYDYRINNCCAYLNYLKLCEEFTQNTDFSSIKESLVKKIGYEVSNFRVIEMIMYETQRGK